MIAFLGGRSAFTTWEPPAGWDKVDQEFSRTSFSSANGQVSVFTRRVVGGETAGLFTYLGGGTNQTTLGIMIALRGYPADAPLTPRWGTSQESTAAAPLATNDAPGVWAEQLQVGVVWTDNDLSDPAAAGNGFYVDSAATTRPRDYGFANIKSALGSDASMQAAFVCHSASSKSSSFRHHFYVASGSGNIGFNTLMFPTGGATMDAGVTCSSQTTSSLEITPKEAIPGARLAVRATAEGFLLARPGIMPRIVNDPLFNRVRSEAAGSALTLTTGYNVEGLLDILLVAGKSKYSYEAWDFQPPAGWNQIYHRNVPGSYSGFIGWRKRPAGAPSTIEIPFGDTTSTQGVVKIGAIIQVADVEWVGDDPFIATYVPAYVGTLENTPVYKAGPVPWDVAAMDLWLWVGSTGFNGFFPNARIDGYAFLGGASANSQWNIWHSVWAEQAMFAARVASTVDGRASGGLVGTTTMSGYGMYVPPLAVAVRGRNSNFGQFFSERRTKIGVAASASELVEDAGDALFSAAAFATLSVAQPALGNQYSGEEALLESAAVVSGAAQASLVVGVLLDSGASASSSTAAFLSVGVLFSSQAYAGASVAPAPFSLSHLFVLGAPAVTVAAAGGDLDTSIRLLASCASSTTAGAALLTGVVLVAESGAQSQATANVTVGVLFASGATAAVAVSAAVTVGALLRAEVFCGSDAYAGLTKAPAFAAFAFVASAAGAEVTTTLGFLGSAQAEVQVDAQLSPGRLFAAHVGAAANSIGAVSATVQFFGGAQVASLALAAPPVAQLLSRASHRIEVQATYAVVVPLQVHGVAVIADRLGSIVPPDFVPPTPAEYRIIAAEV